MYVIMFSSKFSYSNQIKSKRYIFIYLEILKFKDNIFLFLKVKWYPEINHHSPNTPIFLVGTKLDLRNSPEHANNTVSYADGLDLQKKINAVRYFECSALNQTGLKEIFEEACRTVLTPTESQKKKKSNCALL